MTTVPARPEQRASLREHALAVIRHAITGGELAEDKIYSAAGLAKQLGVSLSPVREAMMALVTEGTVEAVPNRGFRLVPVTSADLAEIIRIRCLLAVPAVESLCRRMLADADDPSASDARDAAAGAAASTGTATAAGSQDPDAAEAIAELRGYAEAALAATEAGEKSAFMAADRSFHEHLLGYGLGPRAAAISLRLRDQSRLFTPGISEVDLESARQLIELSALLAEGRESEARELVVDNLYYYKRAEKHASN